MAESRRRQCAKCPWKVGTDPHQIPDGYCPTKHAGLSSTIAEPGTLNLGARLRIMVCHETTPEQAVPCVGWLHNQLGVGNNIGLRLAAHAGQVSTDYELVGEQHQRFEDTLPRSPRKRARSARP